MEAQETKEKLRSLQELKETPVGFGFFLEYIQSQAGSAKLASLERKVDEKVDKQTRLILWIIGIGFTVMGVCLTALLTVMLYLHSDTKQNIQRLDSRIDKLESSIQEIRTLLIQKQTPLPAQAGAHTSRQDTKQSPAKRQAKR